MERVTIVGVTDVCLPVSGFPWSLRSDRRVHACLWLSMVFRSGWCAGCACHGLHALWEWSTGAVCEEEQKEKQIFGKKKRKEKKMLLVCECDESACVVSLINYIHDIDYYVNSFLARRRKKERKKEVPHVKLSAWLSRRLDIRGLNSGLFMYCLLQVVQLIYGRSLMVSYGIFPLLLWLRKLLKWWCHSQCGCCYGKWKRKVSSVVVDMASYLYCDVYWQDINIVFIWAYGGSSIYFHLIYVWGCTTLDRNGGILAREDRRFT